MIVYDRITKVIVTGAVIALIVFIAGVVNGLERIHCQRKEVKEKCVTTNMYIFDSRGHKATVYDCAGITKDE